VKVVLVHGMFAGTGCWDRVDGLLRERGVDVVRASLHPDGVVKAGRGFDAVVASVRTQLGPLEAEPFVLVGHSLGALVVERLLPDFPLASAVFVNPSPAWGAFGPLFPLWIAARRGAFWRGLVRLDPDESHRLLFQGMAGPELEAAQGIVEPESGALVREAFWFFDLLGGATRMRAKTPRDVAVVTGSLDPMATPAYGRRLLARHGRGSTLEVVAGAGHMLMLQDAGAHVLVERIVAEGSLRATAPQR